MAWLSSKMLLLETLIESLDFERYVTHFQLLSQLQNLQEKKQKTASKPKLMNCKKKLQKWAIDFYQTFLE